MSYYWRGGKKFLGIKKNSEISSEGSYLEVAAKGKQLQERFLPNRRSLSGRTYRSLDSATSREVMKLLRTCGERYHQTIVVVTHQEVAQMDGSDHSPFGRKDL